MTYSLEKRKAAVDPCIKYGRNVADIIRKLGHPHRRIHDELAGNGVVAGQRRIARVMREEHLVARGRNLSGVTIDEFMERIGEYIERYNNKRIKRSLGGKSPMDYRRSLDLAA